MMSWLEDPRIQQCFPGLVSPKGRKQLIVATLNDLIFSFVLDGRDGDEQLPRGEIEKSIAEGELTVEALTKQFEETLRIVLDRYAAKV